MTVPFYCVLAAFALIYLPRLLVIRAQAARPEGLDNNDPRDQQAKLDVPGRRAQAAHQNAFEGFAPFAAAVLICHAGGGDPKLASILAVAYVVVRVLYPFIYVSGLGYLRTAVWAVGFLSTLALFVLPAF